METSPWPFMWKPPLLALILLAFAKPAEAAAQMTIADLGQMCNSSDAVDDAACRFFILGVIEGTTLGTPHRAGGHLLCIAPGTSIVDLRRVVTEAITADLAAFPGHKSVVAVGFVAGAAMKAFPCHKGH